MSFLLNELQVQFLISQNIPLSKTFDANGYTKKDYSEIMKEEDLLVAYNTTPCNLFSHTLRSRYGHCIQCNTQALAFIKRYSERGLIYLIHSNILNKCKIGICKDINERLRTLNSQRYGNANDWRLIEFVEVDNSARIEYNISKIASPYKFETEYIRTGKVIKCQEIYSFSIEVAQEIIKKARKTGL
jgi:hypothetical protein